MLTPKRLKQLQLMNINWQRHCDLETAYANAPAAAGMGAHLGRFELDQNRKDWDDSKRHLWCVRVCIYIYIYVYM